MIISKEYQILDAIGLCDSVKKSEKTYIYGAGMVGRATFDYLVNHKLKGKIESFLVSEVSDSTEVDGLDIKSIKDICITNKDLVLVCAKNPLRQQLKKKCEELGLETVIEIDCFDDRNNNYYSNMPELYYPIELADWYKNYLGKELNLNDPCTFNEKINWMKLYEHDDRKTILSDKYLVREYVTSKIGEEYLIPLLGVWDNSENINFESLPQKFVIKCNHGSGWNLIVEDKTKIDVEQIKEKINKWMGMNYAYEFGFELQYRDIKPKVLVEEYLENQENDLFDYKFWCFNGKVEFIMFLSNRKKGLLMDNYSKEWDLLPFTYDYPNSNKDNKKPNNLNIMIEIAEKLAEGFNFVRVDLYRLNDGQIKFGELTFTPASGVCKWSDNDIDYQLGKKILL